MTQHVFIIGTVWPEPASSAAGSRLLQLIDVFQKNAWIISFASAAQKGEHAFHLENLQITTYQIKLNDSEFDELIKNIKPSIVVFDRFISEEQYGWRITEHCTNALKILDTIDLHCLRNERHLALKQNRTFQWNDLLTNELAKREIASIYRCDISLMISEVEMDILKNIFKIDSALLHYCGFMYPTISESDQMNWPSFKERKNFLSIGNFLHEPNWDAVLYLKNEIWPAIRKQLPQAELQIYGAYSSQKVLQLHQVKEGFLIKGRAMEVGLVMKQALVCLAPLRFGAGIKGKLADSMLYGTPNVTSSIGSESMHGSLPWNGFICDEASDFIEKSVELYRNEKLWCESQKNGIAIINQYFENKNAAKKLSDKIVAAKEDLDNHRTNNFIGNLLQQHQFASSKFMSLWIEAKNKTLDSTS